METERFIELSNPRLVTVEDGERQYAGGDQSWLPTKMQRDTGCGSISLTNQLFFFELRRRGDTRLAIPKEDFLREYGIYFGGAKAPSIVPTAGWYASLGVRLLRSHGHNVRAVNRSTLTMDAAAALAMITELLASDTPVGLQNWWGGAAAISWHWVTITGVRPDPETPENSTLRFSTWGELRACRLRDAWRGKASLAAFQTR